MAGITSYGAYIPWYRINRKIIYEQVGWFDMANAALARGEKAVANYDEDTITMAVAAAKDCLIGTDGKGFNGLYLASTSMPFAERQNAVIASEALNYSKGVRTADFGGSLKAGTTALLTAIDGVKDGEAIMVCGSDAKLGKPASGQELTYGDGAAAFLVGTEGVIAEFKGSYSVARDFVDNRRLSEERFGHVWESRWIRDEGYEKIIPEAAIGLAGKYNLNVGDFAKIIIACPVAGAVKGIGRALGAKPEQIQDNMMANVGDTGVAMPLMMLVAALEEAKPGDKIMVLSWGNGSDALYFEVTGEIEKVKAGRKGVKGHLPVKKDLVPYGKYLIYKNIIPLEIGIRGEELVGWSMSLSWNIHESLTSLVGCRCKVCGTPQFPKRRVCVNPECDAVDQMEDYCFSDVNGKLISYTGDNLASSYDPPLIYGLVDFEGGGRMFLNLTDCGLDSVKVGVPVKMSFRRKQIDPNRGYYGYFWKAVPVRE